MPLPPLPVLHMMARSGGTAVTKCLAVMSGVAVLSEVNPAVTALSAGAFARQDQPALETLWTFDPIRQAHQWYQLITPADFDRLRKLRGPIPFEEAVTLIHRRAAERGLRLLVRDWSHLDFLGSPFLEQPTYALRTAEVLRDRFATAQAFVVRHPVDQWLSMESTSFLRNSVGLDDYLRGCRRFAEFAARSVYVRFDEFTRDPDAALHTLCETLGLEFDPSYKDRWAGCTTITGDVRGTRAQTQILPLPRRAVSSETLERFWNNADYRATLDMLGFEHLQSPAPVA